MLAALAHGLPLVLLPIDADQPINAERCTRLGVGRVLGPAERTPEAIRAATVAVLAQRGYRANTARLQAEMAVLPGLHSVVEFVEALAVEHRRPVEVMA